MKPQHRFRWNSRAAVGRDIGTLTKGYSTHTVSLVDAPLGSAAKIGDKVLDDVLCRCGPSSVPDKVDH